MKRFADLWARYERLAPGPKLVLQVRSLIFIPVTKGAFSDCLARSGLRAPDGRAWAYHSVMAAAAELVKDGLLSEKLECPPGLLHPVSVDAVATKDGPAMLAAARKAFIGFMPSFYPGYQHRDGPSEMAVRLAVYANDPARFAADRGLLDMQPVPFRTIDFLARVFVETEEAWRRGRDPVIQTALLEARLMADLQGLWSDPGLPREIAYYRGMRDQPEFAGVRALLLYYDVCSGRVGEVGDIATLDEGVLRSSLQGAVDFLGGRNEAALAAFRTALKLRRKQVGKRKVFLEGVPGLLFLLALLRAHDPKLHGEVQSGLDVALAAPARHSYAFGAVQVLLWLAEGAQAKARVSLESMLREKKLDPLSTAFQALAEYVLDADASHNRLEETIQLFQAAKQRWPLVGRICAEILVKLGGGHPYKAYLEGESAGWEVAFTDIVVSRPPWERALQSLENFLGGEVAPTAAVAARPEKRLVWFVDPVSQFIDVAEQTAKGRDGWTDGRAIALKRLYDRDPRLTYLTEQDRAALRGLLRVNDWGHDAYEFDPMRVLPALVGHPAVFHAGLRSRRLELVSYPLELVVSERENGFHVALSHFATEPVVFLEAETPGRYRVIELPRKLLPVQEILGPRGLIVPTAGRDQLVALARRDNPTLPIRSELAEVGQTAMAGDPAPVAQCVPFEAGLRLNLLVRPFGPEGPAFVAGLGGRSVLGSVDGETRRATRDLDRELAERAALVAACPTLRDRGGADAHEVVIEDIEGALELLLELQAYAGTLSVEWPEGQRFRVSAVMPGKMKLRVGQERDWFSVDGSVAIDDDQVLEMRFLLDRLGRAQGRFVQLEDGRFVALTRQLQAQLQRLDAVSEPSKNGRRVHALGAAALAGVLEDAGEVSVDAAWKKHIARIRKAEGFTPAVPAHLQAELRDYQVEGFAWMARLARWGAGACLADDMGLGKTVQAIAVLLDRAADGPALVVAPTSVAPNWEAEIARFAPNLTTHRFAAVGDRAALVEAMGPRDVLVCSYGLLHAAAEMMAEKAWHTVVLDEAQAIKNATTKRAQASLGLQAGFRMALTGTPVENDLDELWSLFSFVNPGLLGSREGFQKRFAVPIERDRDPAARQALRALIRPFLLRRTKAAVLSELPPRIEQTMQVEKSDAERAFYEALRQRAVEAISLMDAPKGQRRIQILSEIMRLRRACCNPALIDPEAGVPSGKLEAFLELVDDLIRNRHQALVFSQFVGHLQLVRAALDQRGIAYEYLDGSTPSAERERSVKAFQSGSADFFLISLRAGGTGLNLTAADYVVHLDPWWNPAVEDQASDRAHRIGQERPVTIYRLVMQDSIEERILQLHRDKRDLASELLEGGEAAGRLSEDELLDLIRG